ncbi:hypothetical protein HYV44_01650 [Candidatus Microgenomates bacterium]|nr:hypothetical protein [Candidatus Microgenomates bacterium]
MDTVRQPITTETVLGHIKSKSDLVAQDFDSNYDEIFYGLAEEIAESLETLIGLIDSEGENALSDADFQSAIFLWNGLGSIISAIEIFRRGHILEPQTILRMVVETVASAFDIHSNPDKLIQLKSNKYDSTKAISIATKAIPLAGQEYGVLSNYISHISLLHTAPKGNLDQTNPTLWIGGGYKKEHEKYHYGVFMAIKTTLSLLNEFMEVIFYEKIKKHKYIKKNLNGELVIDISEPTAGKWKSIAEKFRELMDIDMDDIDIK